MELTVWNADWDSLTLEDIGFKQETPTSMLETYFERAVYSQKQLEMFMQVVGNELEKRMNEN